MPLTEAERAELEQLKHELSQLPTEAGSAPMYGRQTRSVLQEQHPDIGVGTRMLLKNLANSPESQAAYLQKQGLESKVMDGQVVAKRPDETQWRVLDPSELDLQDITDVGYDVASGIGSGIATAAGGLAGGVAGGPAGALAGGAAAGGASSAGLEALRQKLGQQLGIPQEVDTGQVAMSGGLGAAAPLLFGTGATMANVAGKGLAGKLASRSLQNAPDLAALEAAQSGLISKGYGAVKSAGPKVAEYVTGVPAKATEAYMANKEAVKNLGQEGALTSFGEASLDKLKSGLGDFKQEVGKKLEAEIDSSGKTVNIAKVRQHIDDFINKLETGNLAKNPTVQEEVQAFKQQRDKIFKEVADQATDSGEVAKTLVDLPPEIPASKAFDLQELVKDLAELRTDAKGTSSRFSQGATSHEKQFAEAGRRAYDEVNSELSNATSGASKELKDQYRQYSTLQKALSSRFKDPAKTVQTLSNVNNPSNKMLKESLQTLAQKTGGQVNLIPEADVLYANKYFQSPALSPVATEGSNTGRNLSLSALGGWAGYSAGGMGGAAAGAAAGRFAGSPYLLKNAYIPAGQTAARIGDATGRALYPGAVPATQSIWNMMNAQQKRGK